MRGQVFPNESIPLLCGLSLLFRLTRQLPSSGEGLCPSQKQSYFLLEISQQKIKILLVNLTFRRERSFKYKEYKADTGVY